VTVQKNARAFNRGHARFLGLLIRHHPPRALLSALACSRSNVLRRTATLAVNDPLRAAMLFADAEYFPDFRTPALDEILAVRVVVSLASLGYAPDKRGNFGHAARCHH